MDRSTLRSSDSQSSICVFRGGFNFMERSLAINTD
jgi:hypothetical protein